MATTGDVQIAIVDNGGSANVNVPGASVFAVAGCSSIGTANQPMATKSIKTITDNFGYGPGPQLAALLIALGATVIFTKATQNAVGTATAVVPGAGNTGATVMTLVLDGTAGAFDTGNCRVKCAAGGTIGTAGVKIQISIDAGRNYGPEIALGTATVYTIPKTGIQLSFTVATIALGDTFTFSTVEPKANAAGIVSTITALKNSVYATSGWGHMIDAGDRANADLATIETALDGMVPIFNRLILNARDAAAPAAWGGAGETEATWQAAVLLDFSAMATRRVAVSASHWNIPGAIAMPEVGGIPFSRRPVSWAIAARKAQLAPQGPQVLSSRVSDGPLDMISVNPSSDPTDGFIYHDERINPGFDAARLMSLCTRLKKGPVPFVRSENLGSPIGSDFDLLAVGECFDNFCTVLYSYFTDKIDSTTRYNKNGTIYENDAKKLEKDALKTAVDTLPGQMNVETTSVVIDRTYNTKTNKKVLVSGIFGGVLYIREIDLTLQMFNPNAA